MVTTEQRTRLVQAGMDLSPLQDATLEKAQHMARIQSVPLDESAAINHGLGEDWMRGTGIAAPINYEQWRAEAIYEELELRERKRKAIEDLRNRVVLIQRHVRGFLVRIRYAKHRSELEVLLLKLGTARRQKGAVRIQRQVRGFISRLKLQRMKAEVEAQKLAEENAKKRKRAAAMERLNNNGERGRPASRSSDRSAGSDSVLKPRARGKTPPPPTGALGEPPSSIARITSAGSAPPVPSVTKGQEAFLKGFDLFLKFQYDEAAQLFELHFKKNQGDKITERLIERCRVGKIDVIDRAKKGPKGPAKKDGRGAPAARGGGRAAVQNRKAPAGKAKTPPSAPPLEDPATARPPPAKKGKKKSDLPGVERPGSGQGTGAEGRVESARSSTPSLPDILSREDVKRRSDRIVQSSQPA